MPTDMAPFAGALGVLLATVIVLFVFSMLQLERNVIVKELERFSVRKTRCFCCSSQHRLPDGTTIPCDRKLVGEHIINLYGSNATFDDAVRGELREAVEKFLGSRAFVVPPSVMVSQAAAITPFPSLTRTLTSPPPKPSLRFVGQFLMKTWNP